MLIGIAQLQGSKIRLKAVELLHPAAPYQWHMFSLLYAKHCQGLGEIPSLPFSLFFLFFYFLFFIFIFLYFYFLFL